MKVIGAELHWIYVIAGVCYFLFSLWEQNQKKKRLEDLAARKKERERIQSLEKAPVPQPRPVKSPSLEESLYEIFNPHKESDNETDEGEHREVAQEHRQILREHQHESRSHQAPPSEHSTTVSEHRRNPTPMKAPLTEAVAGESRGLNVFDTLRQASVLASAEAATKRRSRNSVSYSLFKHDPRTTMIKAFVWSEILNRPLSQRSPQERSKLHRRVHRF